MVSARRKGVRFKKLVADGTSAESYYVQEESIR